MVSGYCISKIQQAVSVLNVLDLWEVGGGHRIKEWWVVDIGGLWVPFEDLVSGGLN